MDNIEASPSAQPGFEVSISISRPLTEVYSSVTDPALCSKYFMNRSSGRIKAGTSLSWDFGSGGALDVYVRGCTPNAGFAFEWIACMVDYKVDVEFEFFSQSSKLTEVTIRSRGWRNDAAGLKSAFIECAGWMAMLKNLKAFTEFGIDLR